MKSIAAISTPPGIGGIAVIRLSGDDAFLIADKIWKGTPLSQLPSHTARLGIITDSDGEMLDQAVATIYAEGKSFTGEPTVEFSVHGSKWIQKRVLERLIEEGASAAGPGEFTKRAFLNGRLDLAQSEAVADMIAASSKASQRLAAAQMKGTFSQRLNDLRDRMIQLASLLELELDFSEEDVEFADRSQLLRLTESTHEEISRLAASFRTGRALKEGVAVVIAGAPNAGKSTLLNHLLQDEKAIISDIPGTTRDIIEDTAEINGILFRFIDTAGIRHTTDRIEQIGVDRARNVLTKADIILHLIDSTPNPTSPTLSADDLSADILTSLPADTPVIKVYTKSDLQQESATKTDTKSSPELQNESSPEPQNDSSIEPQTESSPELQKAAHPHIETVSISVKTGKGIPQLIDLLTVYATGGA
ncbi:MAG: tRNA uridine-5-carboxymethylaminomethyl(34) synthesis GTPase MnmE, partial [Muribaculaceae bacterium]|nr:tRNA uridine-5-carboxymethylaminomethyl(34) synthesis GTPase MnmE [Muribaculaceae bacterium]